ncbi:hypothetical protein X805_37150 [Sphaerotilus natans subsp. natans DSM 6575]|uniref:Uncharacterized protein n=1 Tax=Sphaerotilus natans subsp. natans DSM 6575 TaxID=1286631 RepID=A0A059KHY1_9BURK|nr:hypothetical protein X805_37150 [Sphaerotilus natans subsp. natans DSM 6575]
MLHQRGHVLTVVGKAGQADRGTDLQRVAEDFHRLADGVLQPFGQHGQHGRIADPLEQQHELVAAHACCGVVLAQLLAQPPRDLDQQRITHGMAQGVVDLLEAVQVDEHQAEALALAARDSQRPLEPIEQQRAVGQPGQHIVKGQETDALLVSTQLGDVVEDADAALGLARQAGHPADAQPLAEELAVLAPVPQFARPVPLTQQPLPLRAVEIRLLVLGAQQAEPAPDHLLGRIAGQRREGRIDRQDGGLRIGDDDAVHRAVEHAGRQLQLGGDTLSLGQLLAQLQVRLLQLERARAHLGLQRAGVLLDLASGLPLGAQRARELADLDGVEGLLQDQQPVAHVQPREHLLPGVVGIGGADDDLQPRVFLPQPLDGLDAIPARRHAHVDEGHRVGSAGGAGGLHHRQRLAPLQRRVDLEAIGRRGGRHRRRVGEQCHLQRVELVSRLWRHGPSAGRIEDLAEVLVDRGHVVHEQDASVVHRVTRRRQKVRGLR